MNYKEKLLITAALIACGGNAFAANTADLKVIGKIIPSACTPTFSSGGVVDYGTIDGSTLSATAATPLGTKSIPYTVSCTSAMKIGLRFTDNRQSSVYSGGAQLDPNTTGLFGLGMDGSAKIGNYGILNNDDKTADGVSVSSIQTRDSGSTWIEVTKANGGYTSANPSIFYSFAQPGQNTPVAARLFTGAFDVYASVAPTSELDLSHEINLDGLATLEISYL